MLRGALRMGSLALLVVCLLWMDMCLYYHIQTMRPESIRFEHSYKNTGGMISAINSGKLKTSSVSSRLKPVNATLNVPSIILSADRRNAKFKSLISKFSFAFRGMSVKLMMTDPVDNYLLGPLADAFGDLCNFRENFHFVTADMVSFAGVTSALVAAKLVSVQNSPSSHRLAFVFFQLRTWFDNLDGIVARSRLGITKHVSLYHTPGYIVDGVCDAIGFLAFIWGLYVYLKNSHYITYRYLKSDIPETRSNRTRLLVLIGLFLVQLALCSAGWNKYILQYGNLLESPSSNDLQSMSKLKILQSNIMFILVWFWRLTNGHSWMQFLVFSVLLGKIWHFLEFIKFIGLVEILMLVAITQLHIIDIRNFLNVMQ